MLELDNKRITVKFIMETLRHKPSTARLLKNILVERAAYRFLEERIVGPENMWKVFDAVVVIIERLNENMPESRPASEPARAEAVNHSRAVGNMDPFHRHLAEQGDFDDVPVNPMQAMEQYLMYQNNLRAQTAERFAVYGN